MKTPTISLCALALLPGLAATAQPVAPPAPPPILISGDAPPRTTAAAPMATAASGTPYSIGTPSDEEQYYLELINRARANPTAEGVRLATSTDPDVAGAYPYFGVNLAMLQSEFAALPVRPPLAPNALLAQAATGHTADLYTNVYQGHDGTDGSTLGTRVTAVKYSWNRLGENVFSYAKSAWHGHAGFEVDWGYGGTGGMQTGRGHRANIHGDFREIGIGVFNGTNSANGNTVGPQLVTQDFGSSSQVFLTGVAYYDRDGDGFYDPGEGLGGVTVEVSGASYYATTAISGGYAIPVPSATTTRTVAFTGTDLSRTTTANLTASQNTKVDFTAAYQPPVVSGSVTPRVGLASNYSFTALGGATGYDWQQVAKTAFSDDPADSLGRVDASTTGGYSALVTDVKYSGTSSYHLAHAAPADQYLTYPDSILVAASATISFRSRLGRAMTDETACLEISQDGGTAWQTLYNQAGTNNAGETAFQLRSVSLAAYAGKTIRVRFAYRFSSGSYYPNAASGYGWYVDQIVFTNLHTLAAAITTAVPAGRSFTFSPPTSGTYLLAVRPRTPGRIWPYGPFLEVSASLPPPFVTWAAQQETTAGLPAGTIELHPEGDANGDGVANLTAYALGLSATASAAPPAANVSGGRLRLVYPRDTAKYDVTVAAQVSTDLITWYGVGAPGAPPNFTDSVLASVGTQQTREASLPLASGDRLFLRLSVVRP